MKNKYLQTVWMSLSLITLLSVSFSSSYAESMKSNYAITVDVDRKISIVDLNTLEVIKSAGPFIELGIPTAIDYDESNGRLYVASERGHWQEVYYPLTIFEIKADSIKLVEKFKLEMEKSIGEFEGMSAIYRIKLSPDNKKLYLGYASPKYEKGDTIFDLSSNTIVGELDFYVTVEETIFSPDGKKACMILAPEERMIEKDGERKIKKRAGDVRTYDIEKNEEIEKIEANDLIKSDRGFNPPWQKIDTPLVHIPFELDGRGWKRIKIYDRMSGKETADIDLKEITGGLTPTSNDVLFLSNSKHKVILPMAMSGEQGYIETEGYLVIVDLKRKKVDAKIKIGVTLSNVVLFDTLFSEK